MPEKKELAQVLYEAYAASTGWKSAVTGAQLPAWVDCPEAVKTGWRAAANAALNWAVEENPRS